VSGPTARSELVGSFRLLGRTWKPILIYGFAIQTVSAFLLAPLLFWGLSRLLALFRGGIVVNYEIKGLALSLDGLLLGVLWVAVVVLLSLLSIGGGVVIAGAAHEGVRLTPRALSRRVLSVLPRLLDPSVLLLALWGLVCAPLALAGITALTGLFFAPTRGGPTAILIPKDIAEVGFVFPLLAGAAVLSFLLYVRWSLVLQGVFLERLSFRRALARSASLLRGSYWQAARTFLLDGIVSAAILGLLWLVVGQGTLLVTGLAKDASPAAFTAIVAALLVLNGALLGGGVILSLGRSVCLTTRLWFRLRRERGDEPPTDLADAPAWGGLRHRTALLLGAVLLLVATLFTVPAVLDELDRMDAAVEVTAHRGSSADAPENTLASVRLAAEDGAPWAEVDFMEAKDGTVVLLHDESLSRTAGVDRFIWDMTGDELTALDVGAWFDPTFAGERIATIDEVLAAAKGKIRLNLELKVHGREKRFVATVVEAIRRADFGEDCVLTSLDYEALRAARALDPDLRLGIIIAAKIGDTSALDVDFYSVQPLVATVDFVRRAHQAGRQVHVWTVNDPARMREVIDRGIDNLITDHPRRALAVLEERTPVDELHAALVRLFRRD